MLRQTLDIREYVFMYILLHLVLTFFWNIRRSCPPYSKHCCRVKTHFIYRKPVWHLILHEGVIPLLGFVLKLDGRWSSVERYARKRLDICDDFLVRCRNKVHAFAFSGWLSIIVWIWRRQFRDTEEHSLPCIGSLIPNVCHLAEIFNAANMPKAELSLCVYRLG